MAEHWGYITAMAAARVPVPLRGSRAGAALHLNARSTHAAGPQTSAALCPQSQRATASDIQQNAPRGRVSVCAFRACMRHGTMEQSRALTTALFLEKLGISTATLPSGIREAGGKNQMET